MNVRYQVIFETKLPGKSFRYLADAQQEIARQYTKGHRCVVKFLDNNEIWTPSFVNYMPLWRPTQCQFFKI